MKLKCPDGKEIILDDNLDLSEKFQLIKNIANMYDLYITGNWESSSVKFFLNGLSNYIIYHKELDSSNTNSDIMSKSRIKKLKKFDKNNVLFSELNLFDQVALGIDSENE